MAGFEVSINGRIWVSTEADHASWSQPSAQHGEGVQWIRQVLQDVQHDDRVEATLQRWQQLVNPILDYVHADVLKVPATVD
jgi:hypothetical protein